MTGVGLNASCGDAIFVIIILVNSIFVTILLADSGYVLTCTYLNPEIASSTFNRFQSATLISH